MQKSNRLFAIAALSLATVIGIQTAPANAAALATPDMQQTTEKVELPSDRQIAEILKSIPDASTGAIDEILIGMYSPTALEQDSCEYLWELLSDADNALAEALAAAAEAKQEAEACFNDPNCSSELYELLLQLQIARELLVKQALEDRRAVLELMRNHEPPCEGIPQG